MAQLTRLPMLAGAFALLLVAGGCSAPVKEQPRAGFISDYSKLEKASSKTYVYTSPRIKEYSGFIIERPALLFRRDAEDGSQRFTDEEIDGLLQYFHDRTTRALTEHDGYEVTEAPGPGVARIRFAFTALDESIGALNVALYTKLTGAGLGGAALEAEIVDSVTSEQLAASVQWGSGSRVLRAGFTKLGDAKLQINYWTSRLRKRLDEVNGKDQRSE